MAFIAECTFCYGKVRVPDGAAGMSISCPKCGNYFTLAASAQPPKASPPGFRLPGRKKADAPLASMSGPSIPAVLALKDQPPKGRPPAPAEDEAAQGRPPAPEEYVKPALQADLLKPPVPEPPVLLGGTP